MKPLDKVDNLGFMVARVRAAPNEGERMMVEDLKMVKGIERDP